VGESCDEHGGEERDAYDPSAADEREDDEPEEADHHITVDPFRNARRSTLASLAERPWLTP
jgi:hypothetical protein